MLPSFSAYCTNGTSLLLCLVLPVVSEVFIDREINFIFVVSIVAHGAKHIQKGSDG